MPLLPDENARTELRGKSLRDAPEGFVSFSLGEITHTPGEILAHVGQMAMLRTLAGHRVRGENYFKAEIEIGRISRINRQSA